MSDQQKTAIGCSAEDITDDAHKTVFIGRRNVEGGGRQDDLRLTDFRGVWGFKGDINDTWRYDVYGQYSEVEMQDTFKNDFSITKLARALDVIDVDGVPTCRSGPPCVPWNIFTDGGVTQAALDYLALPAFIRSTTRQKIVDGYVGAHLGDYGLTVPWAKNGVEFIAGAEYRKENLDFSPDSNFSSGDGAGSTFKLPVHGNYDVSEVFTEVSIPLIEGVKWIDALEADLGYRYSDYSTGNETNTYKAAGTWNVMSGLMFRSSFQRAVRAANIRELFLPQTFNLFDMDADPCAFATLGAQPLTTPSPAGYTFAQCALTGVTAADWGFVSSNPAGQYNYVQGGNEHLKPEESDTKSYGVVYSPSFVEKLTVSADYYDITIDKAISNVDPQTILLQCLAGNLGLCGDVHRGAVSSNLWLGNDTTNPNTGFITALNVNIGSYHTQGWDITADYGFDVGSLGSVSLQDTLGLITLWEQQELRGLPIESCKGKWGVACGSPLPDTRNVLRATWTTPWSITLTTAWRYISQVDDKSASHQDLTERNYWDLAALWDITSKATFRVGMNNVLDSQPPIAGNNAGPSNFGNGNVFPGGYDYLGRYYFAGVQIAM
jgi:hypothetical protein